MKYRPSNHVLLVVVVLLAFLLANSYALPAKADEPTDGRINLIPWVNSWGAVAVYCVDQFGHAGGSYTGGGIVMLNSNGQRMLFAREAAITPARVLADQLHAMQLILAGPLYTLWALPDGYFLLTSKPDNEGKVIVGRWKDCIPVHAPSAPASCTGTITLDSAGDVTWSTNGAVPGSVNLSTNSKSVVNWLYGSPWANSGSDVLFTCYVNVTVTLTASCIGGGSISITSAPPIPLLCVG